MAKYTIGSVAKALAAGGVAAISTATALSGGIDLSVLDPGQWALVLGAGLTGFGTTFGVPNAPTAPTADTAAADVARAAESLKAVEGQRDTLAQTAIDLKGVLATAATGIAGDVFEQVLKTAGRL